MREGQSRPLAGVKQTSARKSRCVFEGGRGGRRGLGRKKIVRPCISPGHVLGHTVVEKRERKLDGTTLIIASIMFTSDGQPLTK